MCALIWPTLMCFFATVVTNRIKSLGQTAYQSNWYDYPAELRKFIIFIVARSQEPAYFTGLNLIDCSLEVLGKVRF